MTNSVPDYTEMLIDLEVWDLKHLNDIIAGLKSQGCGQPRRPSGRLAPLASSREFYLNMARPLRPRATIVRRSDSRLRVARQ